MVLRRPQSRRQPAGTEALPRGRRQQGDGGARRAVGRRGQRKGCRFIGHRSWRRLQMPGRSRRGLLRRRREPRSDAKLVDIHRKNKRFSRGATGDPAEISGASFILETHRYLKLGIVKVNNVECVLSCAIKRTSGCFCFCFFFYHEWYN